MSKYFECVVNDRGFVKKPAQITEIAPTLRAQDHGNQPKVIEICGGALTVEDNNTPGIEVIGMLENSGTTQQHNNRAHSVDGISPTLTAVSGGTHHIKIFDISRFRVRKLTPTEYGRLQAFPVDNEWEQVVSDSQAYKQFGNAVTVTVITAIAEKLKEALTKYYEQRNNIQGKGKKIAESAINTDKKISDFIVKQNQPYEFKVNYARIRAWEFYNECCKRDLNVHISVGGLDSITLLLFLRSIGINIPAISVTILEDKSIQQVHKQLGVTAIKPYMSKAKVLRELGFPVVSKAKAKKISILQNPNSEKQTFIHAIMTGDMGKQGHFQHSEKIKLPDKWLKLFAGYYNEHRPDLDCKIANFPVSSDCCYYMKEKPCDDWAKEHNSVPYLGLMASEGGQRELGLMKNGCNYFGKSVIRSCPFAIFSRQDLLKLAVELNVPVPKAYGEIVIDSDGILRTTRAQRTGCSMCGFGIHMEKRPHRFDRLYEDNPKEWHYWMYNCCTDENGEKYGWGRVLTYIGVPWEFDEAGHMIDIGGQIRLF